MPPRPPCSGLCQWTSAGLLVSPFGETRPISAQRLRSSFWWGAGLVRWLDSGCRKSYIALRADSFLLWSDVSHEESRWPRRRWPRNLVQSFQVTSRKIHSTSQFAMTILSKWVCVCAHVSIDMRFAPAFPNGCCLNVPSVSFHPSDKQTLTKKPGLEAQGGGKRKLGGEDCWKPIGLENALATSWMWGPDVGLSPGSSDH